MGPRVIALAFAGGLGLISGCASTDSIDTGIDGTQTSTSGVGGAGGQGGAHSGGAGGLGGGSTSSVTGGTGGTSTGSGGGTAGGGTGGGTAGGGTGGTAGGGGTGGGTAGGGTAGAGGGTAGGGTGGGTAGGGTAGAGGGTAGGGTGGAGGCESKAELCNGLDDNCNGQADENNPESGLLCVAAGMGECKKGTSQCINGAVKCIPGEKQPDICDGLDNNCDGNVDEGNPGGGLSCTTEFLGVCKSGITKCDGINGVICKPSVVPGSLSESCNGLDDDCDGVVDNAVSQVGQTCQVSGNQGECKTGTYSCPTSPPFQLKCDTPSPVQETCNSKDDDCNGSIDDGAANNQSCDTGLDGVCKAGKTSCQGGSTQCVQQIQSSNEVCDNKDNNCNGTVDEGNPGGGGACTVLGAIGECKKGMYVCTAGSVLCVAGSPQAETCDGLDNDCNGVADNGNPGGGAACSSGKPGICAAGTTVCSGGSVSCNANVQPGTVPETCNSKDDDCDGAIDDNLNGFACATGLPGVCSTGKTLCSGGSSSCTPDISVGSQTEVCDNKDNNCNGSTDEMNPTTSCASQYPSAGNVSSWACSSACQIATCASGYANIDNAIANGCECSTDQYATVCASASTLSVALGTLAGNPVVMAGGIETAGGSDYVKFNFPARAIPGVWHPTIKLANDGSGQFAMDVQSACGTNATCGIGTGANVNTWEVNYNYGSTHQIDNTAKPATLIVRIYRKNGNAPTCDRYRVEATNP